MDSEEKELEYLKLLKEQLAGTSEELHRDKMVIVKTAAILFSVFFFIFGFIITSRARVDESIGNIDWILLFIPIFGYSIGLFLIYIIITDYHADKSRQWMMKEYQRRINQYFKYEEGLIEYGIWEGYFGRIMITYRNIIFVSVLGLAATFFNYCLWIGSINLWGQLWISITMLFIGIGLTIGLFIFLYKMKVIVDTHWASLVDKEERKRMKQKRGR